MGTLADELDLMVPELYRFEGWQTPAMNLLMRAMTGRVGDNHLPWSTTGAGEVAMAMWTFRGELVRHRIPLSLNERRLLVHLTRCSDAESAPVNEARTLPLHTPGEPLPAYAFSADPPTPADLEASVIHQSRHIDTARRLVRAYRRPANATALQPATWVYILELDPPAAISRIQGQLARPAPAGPGPHQPWCLVDVVAHGETLPRYHRDALAAGRVVWERSSEVSG